MSLVERFIEKQLHRVELANASDFQLSPEQGREVVSVADPSIAASSGIRAGDRLLLVNGRPAANVNIYEHRKSDQDLVLLFERASGNERMELRTKGASIGVNLRNIAKPLDESADPLTEYQSLLPLWENGRWKELHSETERRLNVGLSKRLVMMMNRKSTDSSPAALFQAAATYELGNRLAGYKSIDALRANYEKTWPKECKAVAEYYSAREQLKVKEQRKAEKILHDAIELWPSSRISQSYAELSGRRSGRRIDWSNKIFPEMYQLPGVGKSGDVSLSQTLEGMKRHQLLFLVLLGGFRSNEEYAQYVRRFMHWMIHFQPFMVAMHTITTTRDRAIGVSLPEHLQDEEQAIRRRFPISVAWDRDHQVHDRIQPTASPWPMLLNHQGRVLHVGMPSDVEWWQLLNEVGSQ